jgi:hypothetical protein
MSGEKTTVETPTEPTPIENPVTTEVPNAADVPTEELTEMTAVRKPKKVESR